jgi:DNA invertase Pin-like site-specific DNA recombinase
MTAAMAVAYYRVSTQQQGRSGLGLEAQAEAVARFAADRQLRIVASFTEIETGRSPAKLTLDKRPQLGAALVEARRSKALLVIATLDRLSRNLAFIAGLMETKVPFVAVDMPSATRFMLHIYAAVAEEEGRLISERIKGALAVAKARGKRWDHEARRQAAAAKARAEALRPVIEAVRAAGCRTEYAVAKELNRRGVPFHTGKPWIPFTARVMLRHLGLLEPPEPYKGARVRGAAVARAEPYRQVVAELAAAGHRTPAAVRDALNARAIATAEGRPWDWMAAKRLLVRIGAAVRGSQQ